MLIQVFQGKWLPPSSGWEALSDESNTLLQNIGNSPPDYAICSVT